MGPFLILELHRRYLYQNGVEFHYKLIGAGLNLFWGHLHYFSGGLWTFPSLSDTRASAPIAERTIHSKLLIPNLLGPTKTQTFALAVMLNFIRSMF